jgi:hypothetical protein
MSLVNLRSFSTQLGTLVLFARNARTTLRETGLQTETIHLLNLESQSMIRAFDRNTEQLARFLLAYEMQNACREFANIGVRERTMKDKNSKEWAPPDHTEPLATELMSTPRRSGAW